MKSLLLVLGALTLTAVVLFAAHDDGYDYPYLALDNPAIKYANTAPNDPVTQLGKQLDAGTAKLDYSPKDGYLPSLLKHLGIHPDSQMLVFSKTSFQAPKISPQHPRAIYFTDNAMVGFVPEGDVFELIGIDPKQGVIFYTLDREKTDKPSFFRRNDQCVSCHLIPNTMNVPGLMVTSVIPSSDGSPRFPGAAVVVDSRTPLEDRWGGWFVTGTSGSLVHRGNAMATNPDQPSVLDTAGKQNLTSLPSVVDRSPYLENTSDLIALLTLEHQARMTDLLVRLDWEARIAQQEGKLAESQKRLEFVAGQVADYMLFANEAKILDPIAGVSTFTKSFEARGPRDQQGRSLRDFDLKTRLFKYPLSYMIYSAQFDALPDVVKQMVYQRLYDVLSGKDTSPDFESLTPQNRQAILEIVRETKKDLPKYWYSEAPAQTSASLAASGR
jgi:hypothetical protein